MSNSIYAHGKSAIERAQDLDGYVKALKRELADEIIDALAEDRYLPAEEITRKGGFIAEKEGALQVAYLLARVEENAGEAGPSYEDLSRVLLVEAVRSPQDTWSGRGNDVKRAFADGRRDAIDDAVLEFIR